MRNSISLAMSVTPSAMAGPLEPNRYPNLDSPEILRSADSS